MCYKCDKTGKPSADYMQGPFDPPIAHECLKTESVWDCDSDLCWNKLGDRRRFTKVEGYAEHLVKEHQINSSCADLLDIIKTTVIKKKVHVKKGYKEYPDLKKIENEGLREIANYANFCVRNGVLYLDSSSKVEENEVVNGNILKDFPDESTMSYSKYMSTRESERTPLNCSGNIIEHCQSFNNLQDFDEKADLTPIQTSKRHNRSEY